MHVYGPTGRRPTKASFPTRVMKQPRGPDRTTPRSQREQGPRDQSLSLHMWISALSPPFPSPPVWGSAGAHPSVIDTRHLHPLGSAKSPSLLSPPLHPWGHHCHNGTYRGKPPSAALPSALPRPASEVPSLGGGRLNEFSPGSISNKTHLTQYPPHLLS